MNRVTRRAFLKSTALPLAVLVGSPLFPMFARKAWAGTAPGRELLLQCHTPNIKDMTVYPQLTGPGLVKIFDVKSGETFSIDVPFFGHTTTQNPKRLEQIVTFEKWGQRGALLDVKQKTILAAAAPAEGNTFFGHAAYINDASILVTTEDSTARNAGQLVLRDPATLKVIQKTSSYGTMPHDCRAIDDGKAIMVVNHGLGNAPPNLAWIETATNKLLHKIDLDPGPAQKVYSYGHMDISSDGWIAVIGFQPGQGGKSLVVFIAPDGKVLTPGIPDDAAQKMLGEVLSCAFLGDSGLLAVTIPPSNMAVLFDYKTQELVHIVEILHPSGVLPDLASTAAEPSMYVNSSGDLAFDKVSGLLAKETPFMKTLASGFGSHGRHLTRIYL